MLTIAERGEAVVGKVGTVRIGYVDVPIYMENLDEAELFGYFDHHPTAKIAVDRGLPGRHKAGTILHEVLEAISAVYGLDLTEAQIRCLEASLAQIALEGDEEVRSWLRLLQEDSEGT